MGKLSSLAKDTVVYGASTVLGRLLNWLLMPFYIRTISSQDYGLVVNLYSIIAILLMVVTLGFETGYFRFADRQNNNKLLSSLSSTVLLFGFSVLILFSLFSDFFCSFLEIGNAFKPLFIATLIVIVDAYNSILFASLRYEKRSVLYALLRFLQVVVTVVLTLFFLLYLNKSSLFGIDFSLLGDVNYVLLANLLGSLSSTIYFIPRILGLGLSVDISLVKTVLIYSLPLAAMGFFGSLNQNIEKFLIIKLSGTSDNFTQLAIYSANYKIGILMAIFTQSFRLAFEPFLFKEFKNNSSTEVYSIAMNFFVYFGLVIFAGVALFMPLLNVFLTDTYLEGNSVIPFILLGQLFFGVYYSVSMWYKVVDKTYFGIIMSVCGLILNVILNIILIPSIGYLGAAISTLVGYFFMMSLSFYLGHKHYPIDYKLARLSILVLSVVTIVYSALYIQDHYSIYWLPVSLISLFLILFAIYLSEREILNSLIFKFLHR